MSAQRSRKSLSMKSEKPKKKRGSAKGLALWEYLQPLVEFYNLHLDGSEADKEKVEYYLRKHAPHIFRISKADKPGFWGRLSQFQKTEGIDWFESGYFSKFCKYRDYICTLLDLYIDGSFHVHNLLDLQHLLNDFQPLISLRSRADGSLHPVKSKSLSPKTLDLQRFEVVWGETLEAGNVSRSFRLDIGPLLARIVLGLYWTISKGVRVIRCARRGCHNIYIPKPGAPTTGKAPKYCPACRSKRKA